MSCPLLSCTAVPQVTVNPTTRTAARGSTVTFQCLAQGFPAPDITWHKEGGELPYDYSISNGVLTINNIAETDEGAYVCTAINDGGSSEYTAHLIVGGSQNFKFFLS